MDIHSLFNFVSLREWQKNAILQGFHEGLLNELKNDCVLEYVVNSK